MWVQVLSCADDKRIKIILSQHLQTLHPETNLGKNVLDYIIKKAKKFEPNTSKIDAAQSLLNTSINKMNCIEFKTLELQILKLKDEAKLMEQNLMHEKIGNVKILNSQLERTNDEIAKLEAQLNQNKQQLNCLQKIEAYYLKLKRQSLAMADPAKQLIAGSVLEREWLTLHAQMNAVSAFLRQEKKKLSISPALDISLIDSILQDRKKA